MIPFDFALVHQSVGDRTDEALVDSEAEAKVLMICNVSTERWRLAQASEVLEQVCIKRFRHWLPQRCAALKNRLRCLV